MTSAELSSVFRSLPRPSAADEETFSVYSFPDFPVHRLAKDAFGAPALLLRVVGAERVTPIALQNFSVQHGVRCRMRVSEEVNDEDLTVIRCATSETALRETFVRIAEILVRQIGSTPSGSAVNRSIRRLVELFRAFELPARRSVQGLWAELLLILASTRPEELIDAWHVDAEEAFDSQQGARESK